MENQFQVIVFGGKIQIMVPDGVSFAAAEAATKDLIERLNAQGIPIELQGKVEQHSTPGATHVHLLNEGRINNHGR